MHDSNSRILTQGVQKVQRRGKNVKVVDTEAVNLVNK